MRISLKYILTILIFLIQPFSIISQSIHDSITIVFDTNTFSEKDLIRCKDWTWNINGKKNENK
jgi:hypothetical protein